MLIIVRVLIGSVPHCRIIKLIGIKHVISLTLHFIVRVTIKLASLICKVKSSLKIVGIFKIDEIVDNNEMGGIKEMAEDDEMSKSLKR